MALGGFEALSAALGLEKLKARGGPAAAGIVAAMTREVGVDPTTPAGWTAMGLDPKRPFGLVALGDTDDDVAVFAAVSDPAKVQTTVTSVLARSGEPASIRKVGELTVVVASSGAQGIVIGPTWLVGVDSGGDAATKRVVATQPDGSLARAAGFRDAMGRLAFGVHGAVWVDLVGALARSAAATRREVAERAAGRKMADAAREGVGREALEKLQETLTAEIQRSATATKKELDAIRLFFGAQAAFSAGLAASDRGIQAKVRLDLGPDAILQGLVKDGSTTAAIVAATEADPLYLFGGRLDTARLATSIKRLVAATGGDEVEGVDAMLSMVNLDLASVLGLLTGEVGVAVTGQIDTTADAPRGAFGKLEVSAVAGIAAMDRVNRLLDKAAAFLPFKRLITKEGLLWRVRTPWKPLWLGLDRSHLGISTDKAFFQRLASRGPSFSARLTDPLLRKIAEAPAAITGYTQLGGGGLYWLLMARSPDAPSAGNLPEAQRAELEKARADLKKLTDEVDAIEEASVRKVSAALGTLAGWMSADAQGYSGFGGLFLARSPADAVYGVLDTILGTQEQLAPKRKQVRVLRGAGYTARAGPARRGAAGGAGTTDAREGRERSCAGRARPGSHAAGRGAPGAGREVAQRTEAESWQCIAWTRFWPAGCRWAPR